MIEFILNRYNEYTNVYYYIFIYMIPKENEIIIMYNDNQISLKCFNDLLYTSVSVEVKYE